MNSQGATSTTDYNHVIEQCRDLLSSTVSDRASNTETGHQVLEPYTTMLRGLSNHTSINWIRELSTRLPIEHPITCSQTLFTQSAHQTPSPLPSLYGKEIFFHLLEVATKVIILAYTSQTSPTPKTCNSTNPPTLVSIFLESNLPKTS